MASFFAPEIILETKAYTLSEEESKHCVRVLRKKKGDFLELLNGKGVQLKARIIDDNPKKCSVEVLEAILHPEAVNEIHIAVAPTKNMDRIEWFLEKATELGLTKLTFLKCANNERNNVNLERIHKIAVAAMKQSKRFYLPEIEDLKSVTAFINETPKAYIGHCYEGEKAPLKSMNEFIPFLIGPEGDFSETEVKLALEKGFIPINLSENRLRTETAALTAVFGLVY